ncbi:condensation domain-containing protein, partial [Paenibacillus polymyxa]|uniref:condensation domain-containing protein n=1 Tax=Paenibacillus polymyxa TaxID=1406 RepID=UPI002AB51019
MNKNGLQMYHLTQAQQRVVYTELQYPNTAASTISGTIKLSKHVDLKILEIAIQNVLQANDAFLIRITEVDGVIKQYVAPYKYKKIQFIDFDDDNSNNIIYDEWLEKNNKIPINMYDTDLTQIILFKNNEEYGYNLKIHHSIADGISLGITINEITKQYNDLISKNTSNYTKQHSYIDYIADEEEYLKSLRFEKDKAYWIDKFKEFPSFMEIKTHNPKITSTVASRKKILVYNKQYKDIQKFCTQQRISVFTFFLGVLYLYLNKITNESDIVIGTNYANRTSKEEKETLGMFVSTVAFRNEIKKDQCFIEIFHNISKEQIKILRHQKYPYNRLVQDFRVLHDANEIGRLFGIALEYRPLKWMKMDGQVVKAEHDFCGHEINDILLRIVEMIDEEALELHIDYRVNLFNEKEIDALIKSLLKISQYAITYPYMTIEDLSLIEEPEKKLLLEDFNNTATDYPKDTPV